MLYSEKIEAYHVLLSTCLNVVESNKGINVTKKNEYLVDIENISLKLLTHLISIADLLEYTQPKVKYLDTSIRYLDFHSINVLTRTALEAFLTMNHMYFENVTSAERKLRWKLWELSYLSNRQKVNVPSKTIHELQENEKKQMKALRIKIRKSKYFKTNIADREYSKINKNHLKQIDWKPNGGLKTMALNAGFNEKFYDDIYNHLSASTHTDLTTLHEIENVKTDNDRINMVSVALTACFVIMALFLKRYYEKYPPAKAIIDANSTSLGLMTIYSDIPQKGYTMDSIE